MVVELADIYAYWIEHLQFLWNYLQMPLKDVLDQITLNPVLDIIEDIIEALPIFDSFYELSLLSVILGGSVLVYIVLTLCTWFLNLVT